MTDSSSSALPSSVPHPDGAEAYREYAAWNLINHFVEHNFQVLEKGLSSSRLGNHPVQAPTDLHETGINLAHQSLRNVMYNLGNLFNPLNLPPHVAAVYQEIRAKQDAYVQQIKTIKVAFDTLYPSPAETSSACPVKTQKPYYKNLDDLYELVEARAEDLDPQQLELHRAAYQSALTTDESTLRLTRTFGRMAHKLPHVVLENAQKEQLTIDKHVIHVGNNKTQSILYLFHFLKQKSQHDIDTTRYPYQLESEADTHAKSADGIYPNTKKLLIRAHIDTHPIILNEFRQERIKLTQKLAHQADDHNVLLNTCSLHPSFDSLVYELGLNQYDAFEQAKDSYRTQKSEWASKPRKKPIIPSSGKCPFGHG